MLDRESLIHDAARRSAEAMAAKAEGIRAVLREQPPASIALRSGATFLHDTSGQECLALDFFSIGYEVTCPDFEVRYAGSGEPTFPFMQAIILSYLQDSDGTPRAHRWVAFRELPGGQFYHQAFQGYTGNHLAARLGNDLAAFERGSAALAEVRLPDYGDAAYAFRVLPNLYLAAVYWEGDEEFGPRASILFDETAPHYLPIDGLAVVGSQLVGKILKGAASA